MLNRCTVDAGPNRAADRLDGRIVRSLALMLMVGGSFLALYLVLNGEPSRLRILANTWAAGVGFGVWALYERGCQRQAILLLIWASWLITMLVIAQNFALRSYCVLNIAVIIVAAGWLLGARQTIWLFLLTALLLGTLAALYPWPGTGVPLPGHDFFGLLIYYLFALFAATLVTLATRHSYMARLTELDRSAGDLAVSQDALRKHALVVEQSPLGIFICDQGGRIEYANRAFLVDRGLREEEVLHHHISRFKSALNAPSLYATVWRRVLKGLPWTGQLLNRGIDGDERVKLTLVSPVKDGNGTISHYACMQQDITETRDAQARIRHMAFHDWLTDLPNRASLLLRLEETLPSLIGEQCYAALMVVHIDRFKNLNDAVGYLRADDFLRSFGARLAALVPPSHVVVRLEAALFAIHVDRAGQDRSEAERSVTALADSVREAMQRRFDIETVEAIQVTVSIGITLIPDVDPETPAEVLRRAEIALHAAKQEGAGHCQWYDSRISAQVEERFRIERELRSAIDNRQFCLFLQPQFDSRGCWVGAEVLVRWEHPERGLVSPALFIPIAEETSLIIDIGEQVMREACLMIAREKGQGRQLRLSVNLSPRHFRLPNFVAWVREVLADTGVDPHLLTLEVTEGLVIEDVADVIAKMDELAALGIRFSIDDFGTGYSSLAYLKRLPIDELKIDRSFVQDAPGNPEDAALVDTILSVARHMGLSVVAEGVETTMQADFLHERGVHILQGYLYGRPKPAELWLEPWRHGAWAQQSVFTDGEAALV